MRPKGTYKPYGLLKRHPLPRVHVCRLEWDPAAPAPRSQAEPMTLDELCERLPDREARLLRLIMAQGVDQAEACDQLRRLIEGRGVVR